MFGSFTAHATGMPILDAQTDFRRARRAHAIARAVGRLKRERGTGHPPTIGDRTGGLETPRRVEVVPLDSIVGTLEPTVHFDARFRPASEVVRRRWERIALAHRNGHPLPPIDLVKRPDGYYIVDGRHRVSVALALGHPDIEALVRASPNRWPTRSCGKPPRQRGSGLHRRDPSTSTARPHPRCCDPKTERAQRERTACT
jgi:hypothetical protein